MKSRTKSKRILTTLDRVMEDLAVCDCLENYGFSDKVINRIEHSLKLYSKLVSAIKEAHQPEIDANHHGDAPPCSYCDLIREAKVL